MSNWIRKLFPRKTRPITRPMRLGVESLDSRDLMSATAAIFHDTLVVTGDAATNRISVVHGSSRIYVGDNSVVIADLPDAGVTKIRLENKLGNDAIVDPADLTVVELGIIGVPTGSVPQGAHVSMSSSTNFGFTTITNGSQFIPAHQAKYAWTVNRDGVLVVQVSEKHVNASAHPGTPVSPDFAFNANVAGQYTVKLTVSKLDGTTATAEESFAVTFVAPTAVTITGPAQGRAGTAVTMASRLTGPGLYPNLTTDWVVKDKDGIVVNRSTGPTVMFTPTAIGSYTVFATVTLPDESQLFSTRTLNVIAPSGTAAIDRSTLVVTGGAGDNRFRVVHADSHLSVFDNGILIADLPDAGVTKIRLDNKLGNDAIVDPADLTVVEVGINGVPAGSVPQGTSVSVSSSIDFGFTTVKNALRFDPAAKAGYTWTVNRDGVLVVQVSEKHVNASAHPGTPVSPNFAFDANVAGQYTVKLTVTKLDGTTVMAEESFAVTYVAPKAVTISGPSQERVGTAVTMASRLTGPGLYPNLTTNWVVKDKDGIVVNRSTGPTVMFTPTAIGSYTVFATVALPDGSQLTSTRTLNAITPSGTAAVVRGTLVVTGGAGDNRFRVVHANSRLSVSDNGILIADLPDAGVTKIRLDNKAGNDAIVDPADLTVVELGIIGGPTGSVPQGGRVQVSSSIDFGFTTVKSALRFDPAARAGYTWTVKRDGVLVLQVSENRLNASAHPGTPVSPDFAFDANVAGTYTMQLTVTKLDGTTVMSEELFEVAPPVVS